jgi:hypothetical protein
LCTAWFSELVCPAVIADEIMVRPPRSVKDSVLFPL